MNILLFLPLLAPLLLVGICCREARRRGTPARTVILGFLLFLAFELAGWLGPGGLGKQAPSVPDTSPVAIQPTPVGGQPGPFPWETGRDPR